MTEPPEPLDRPGVAAFDFDGTLTRRDTLVPFVARCSSWPAALRTTAAGLADPGAWRAGREGLKRVLLRETFAGWTDARLRQEGAAYAEGLFPRLRRPMLDRLRWHQDQGHRIVVVSASLHCYLDPVAQALGIDDVLGVALEVDPSGRLTGEIHGPNVRGPEKVSSLRRWLDEEPVRLWAYGDSAGDAELLAFADHPVPVSRRARRRLEGGLGDRGGRH